MSTQEINRLVKEDDESTARKKLRKLAKSKTTWAVLITLAVGGAGWIVARKYMDATRLKGVGEVTIKALEKLGRRLGIGHAPFDARRLNTLKKAKDDILQRVKRGELTSIQGVRAYHKMFKDTDPKEITKLLLTELGHASDGHHIRAFFLRKQLNGIKI
jgi:hypothetical protein